MTSSLQVIQKSVTKPLPFFLPSGSDENPPLSRFPLPISLPKFFSCLIRSQRPNQPPNPTPQLQKDSTDHKTSTRKGLLKGNNKLRSLNSISGDKAKRKLGFFEEKRISFEDKEELAGEINDSIDLQESMKKASRKKLIEGFFGKQTLKTAEILLRIMNNLLYLVVIPLHLAFPEDLMRETLRIPMILSALLLIFEFFIDSANILKKIRPKHEKKRKLSIFMLFVNSLGLTYLLISLTAQNRTKPFDFLTIIVFFSFSRLTILVKSMQFIEKNAIFPGLFAFSFLLIKVALLYHFSACFWHFLAFFYPDSQDINWVSQLRNLETPWKTRYFESLLYVSSHLNNSQSLSIIRASNDLEKLFSMVLSFSSLPIQISVVLKTLEIMENGLIESRDKRQERRDLRALIASSRIQGEMAEKVRRQLKEMGRIRREKAYRERLDSKLSESLRTELIWGSNKGVLRKAFKNEDFSEGSLRSLACAMREVFLLPGDPLFPRPNPHNPLFCIIKKGHADLVFGNSSLPFRRISPGKFLSEEFIGGGQLFVSKESAMNLLLISQDEFIGILKANEEDYARFCEMREKRSDPLKKHSFSFSLFPFGVNRLMTIQRALESQSQQRMAFKRRSRRENALFTRKKFGLLPERRVMEEDPVYTESRDSRKTFDDDTFEDSELNKRDFVDKRREVESGLEFERAKSYKKFFPHNNMERAIQEANSHRKKLRKEFRRKNSLLSFYSVKKSETAKRDYKTSQSKDREIQAFENSRPDPLHKAKKVRPFEPSISKIPIF